VLEYEGAMVLDFREGGFFALWSLVSASAFQGCSKIDNVTVLHGSREETKHAKTKLRRDLEVLFLHHSFAFFGSSRDILQA
jgi:hypothetical protein